MIVSLLDPFDDIGIIIAFIQTQMMQSIDDLLRPVYDEAIQRRQGYRFVVRIGPGYFHRQRGPALVGQHRPFGARFTPIYRGRTRIFAAQRGFGDHPIKSLPFPRNTHFRIIVVQQGLPSVDQHALLNPVSEPTMHGRSGGVGFPRNGLPLTAATQYKDNRVEQDAVGCGRAADGAGGFVRPQNRGDQIPQGIRGAPDRVERIGLGGHGFPPLG